jgi:diguanylate cyclase (GGDEF)-like protein
VDVSLSIGIACLSETQSATDDDLIRQADRALYEAKDHGKARIVLAGGPPVQ